MIFAQYGTIYEDQIGAIMGRQAQNMSMFVRVERCTSKVGFKRIFFVNF